MINKSVDWISISIINRRFAQANDILLFRSRFWALFTLIMKIFFFFRFILCEQDIYNFVNFCDIGHWCERSKSKNMKTRRYFDQFSRMDQSQNDVFRLFSQNSASRSVGILMRMIDVCTWPKLPNERTWSKHTRIIRTHVINQSINNEIKIFQIVWYFDVKKVTFARDFIRNLINQYVNIRILRP